MKCVYLLQSRRRSDERYVGITNNLRERLNAHNAGKVRHTSKYAPWRVVAAVQFRDDARAVAFERYLKSGSGRAFANRHFW